MAVRLDRGAPLPLYFQLRHVLMDEIQTRGLTPGDKLPTEAQIERRYGISRSTIRQALNSLAGEGIVERIQGKGTFVSPPKRRHTPLLTSFTENMLSQGHMPSHRVLASSVVSAPQAIAARLAVDEGAACRFLRRLLLTEQEVIGVAETWLPLAVLGEFHELLDQRRLDQGSLYDLLQQHPINLVLERGTEIVTAGVADEHSSSLLNCPKGHPVLLVDRVTQDASERTVEVTHMTFAGSRYEYRVEMARPAPAVAATGVDAPRR
jgi:GntR family transcriptional regulator